MSSFSRRQRPPHSDGQNEPGDRLPLVWVVILTVAGGTSLAVYTAEGLAAAVATFVAVVGLLHVVVAPR